jgi:hypothetical protein
MTAFLFLAGTVSLATLVALCVGRNVGRSAGLITFLGIATWLTYVGTLSSLGVVGNPSLRPPGILYIVGPVILFVALFGVRSMRGHRLALAIPVSLLMGVQVFRVGVELGIHSLWEQGLVPRLMTYEGGNVDIFIGLSAPVVAWLVSSGKVSRRMAIGWNVLGLLALLNIIARSALTAPGPLNLIHTEVPNLAIGTFPYTFIAGFFAPLAVFLHVLSIRHLRSQPDTSSAQHPSEAAIHSWSPSAESGRGRS